jgi:hypothetical protein
MLWRPQGTFLAKKLNNFVQLSQVELGVSPSCNPNLCA